MIKKYRVLIYCDLEMQNPVLNNIEATIIYDIQECFNKKKNEKLQKALKKQDLNFIKKL